jgi:hypothetical protein
MYMGGMIAIPLVQRALDRFDPVVGVLEMSRSWIIAGVAAVCFVTSVALSHRIEPGVRVENVTLAKGMTMLLSFVAAALVAGWH